MPNRSPRSFDERRRRAVCPECGATVDILRGRWLRMHREGGARDDYRVDRARWCCGSLLRVEAGQDQAGQGRAEG